ncbi:hypothetical protein HELRODRAFT_180711 [Helobdella robusta]|uniref:Uncharacterized protein n=1 Tax=Helobdella robusta TaxID=6412 RepID=T1FG71_HELRO|nr:hypothetical protein HELRODRAFT_180711 [Helobdella robusta]ESN93621.1 hypothetical protein HELRODRAFT_180711 [Helobdella robusta]
MSQRTFFNDVGLKYKSKEYRHEVLRLIDFLKDSLAEIISLSSNLKAEWTKLRDAALKESSHLKEISFDLKSQIEEEANATANCMKVLCDVLSQIDLAREEAYVFKRYLLLQKWTKVLVPANQSCQNNFNAEPNTDCSTGNNTEYNTETSTEYNAEYNGEYPAEYNTGFNMECSAE